MELRLKTGNFSGYISQEYRKYDGDKSISQWLRGEKKSILGKVRELLQGIEFEVIKDKDIKVDLKGLKDMVDRELIISIKWDEKTNIYEWGKWAREDMKKVEGLLHEKGIISYVE